MWTPRSPASLRFGSSVCRLAEPSSPASLGGSRLRARLLTEDNVYPGTSHGLFQTHKDKFNADLLTLVKHCPGNVVRIGSPRPDPHRASSRRRGLLHGRRTGLWVKWRGVGGARTRDHAATRRADREHRTRDAGHQPGPYRL